MTRSVYRIEPFTFTPVFDQAFEPSTLTLLALHEALLEESEAGNLPPDPDSPREFGDLRNFNFHEIPFQ